MVMSCVQQSIQLREVDKKVRTVVKCVEAGHSYITLVELKICRAGHGPIGQSTDLL